MVIRFLDEQPKTRIRFLDEEPREAPVARAEPLPIPQLPAQPRTMTERIADAIIKQRPQKEPSLASLFGAPPQTAEEQEQRKRSFERAAQLPQEIAQAALTPEVFQAAGGTIGGIVGAPAGPAGIAAGGALGTAGGEALFNVVESIRNLFEEQKEEGPTNLESIKEAFKGPIKAGTEDILFNLGLSAVGRVARGLAPLTGKALGVAKKEAIELARLADRLGIPLGAINVTANRAVKGFAKVAGVFPFVGTPIRKAQQTAQTLLEDSLNKTLDAVAPTVSLQEVGVDLTKAGQNKFKAFRRLSGALYDNFLNKAKNATVPTIFPTTNLTQKAKSILKEQDEGTIKLIGGGKFGSIKSDILSSFLNDSTKLPQRLTAQQVRGLQRDLQTVMTKASADGWDISRGVDLKKALELDFNNPQVSELGIEEGKAIVDSLTTANKFFAKNIKMFQTATAKKFGRIDKNIFKPEFFEAGTREADEAFNAVFNSQSPQALQNLRKVVGPKPFRQAVRKHFDSAIEKSIIEPASEGAPSIFDPIKLEAQLGLATLEGRQALEEMLKNSPLKLKDLEDLNRVSKAIGSVEIPDVSTFLTRRAGIAGAKGVTGAFAATQGVISPGGVALMVAARSSARVLSDPAKLKSLTVALDSTIDDKLRRSAILRLIRLLPSKEEHEALQDEFK